MEQIYFTNNFQELISTPFQGTMNTICWNRQLRGNFAEIVEKIALTDNIVTVEEDELFQLHLSAEGKLARESILNDLRLLKDHGASPVLNLIKSYDRDDDNSVFATDVYSFHVDRSPLPTDTFLCTYYGDTSEIIPNSQAIQKVLIPEMRSELQQLYHGPAEGFESFLTENFYDMHYQAIPGATPIPLGLGNLWRLAVDHPEMPCLPCIHRAPVESSGQTRLLLIC